MSKDKFTAIEELTNELIKNEPQEDKIKECMTRVGLTYKQDPIERIDLVLKRIQFLEDEEKENE